MRTLTFCILTSCLLSGAAQTKVDFEVDNRGFEACYGSFVAKVKPGFGIEDHAFDAINMALEIQGNVFQKMAARDHAKLVEDRRMCNAFMENIQGKKRQRAAINESFYNAPQKIINVAPPQDTPPAKRQWRARMDQNFVAPVAKLLEKQMALDIIEQMYTPTPVHLPAQDLLESLARISAPLVEQRPSLKRQRADVADFFPAAKRTKIDNLSVVPQEETNKPILSDKQEPASLVRTRVSFWENLASLNK